MTIVSISRTVFHLQTTARQRHGRPLSNYFIPPRIQWSPVDCTVVPGTLSKNRLRHPKPGTTSMYTTDHRLGVRNHFPWVAAVVKFCILYFYCSFLYS